MKNFKLFKLLILASLSFGVLSSNLAFAKNTETVAVDEYKEDENNNENGKDGKKEIEKEEETKDLKNKKKKDVKEKAKNEKSKTKEEEVTDSKSKTKKERNKTKEEVEDLKDKSKKDIKGEKAKDETGKDVAKTKPVKYKKINPKDYEVLGFKMEPHKLKLADGRFIDYIIYTYEENGAKWVQFLFDDEKEVGNYTSSISFLINHDRFKDTFHALEHMIVSPEIIDKYMTKANYDEAAEINPNFGDMVGEYNAKTGAYYFNALTCDSSLFTKDALELELKELLNPTFLNPKDKGKMFKAQVNGKYKDIQTGRIYDELVMRGDTNYFNKGFPNVFGRGTERIFDGDDSLKGVIGLTLKEVEKKYKEYVHPSNCFVFHFSKKDPDKVKTLLNTYKNEYVSKVKKKEIPKIEYKAKTEKKFKETEIDANSYIFEKFNEETRKTKREAYKHAADIVYNIDKLNLNAQQIFTLLNGLNLHKFGIALKDKAKEMGYGKIEIVPEIITERAPFKSFNLRFVGDEQDLFKEEKLKEKSKEVVKFLLDKIKILKKKNLIDQYIRNSSKTEFSYNFVNQNLLNEDNLLYSYIKTNDFFPGRYFPINEDGIVDLSILTDKKTILNNLGVFEKLAKSEPYWINYYKAKKIPKGKYFISQYNLPIEFPNNKNNKVFNFLNPAIDKLSQKILCNYILRPTFYETGITYGWSRYNLRIMEPTDLISFSGPKSKRAVDIYLKENLRRMVSGFNIKKADFDKEKNFIIKKMHKEIDFLKKQPKEIDYLVAKIEKLDESSAPSLWLDKEEQFRFSFFQTCEYFMFKTKKNAEEYSKKIRHFIKNIIAQKLKREDKAINKEKFNVKTYKENVKNLAEVLKAQIKESINNINQFLGQLKNVTKEQVNEYIHLVKHGDYKKVNKKSDQEIIKEIEEKEKKYYEEEEKK